MKSKAALGSLSVRGQLQSKKYREKLNHASAFANVMLAIYVIIIPGGLVGVLLAGAALTINLLRSNISTIAVAATLALAPIFGEIFRIAGVNLPGSLFPIALTFTYVIFNNKKLERSTVIIAPATWIIVFIALVSLSYLWGPQTEYSSNKIPWMIFNIFTHILVFIIVFFDRTFSASRAGQACISACALYLAMTIWVDPTYTPRSFFETAGIRVAGTAGNLTDSDLASNTLGLVGAWGCIFIISAYLIEKMNKKNAFFLYISFFIGILILNVIGARLFLVIPIIGLLLSVFVKDGLNKSSRNMIAFTVIFIFIVIFMQNIMNDNVYLTQVFGADAEIDERFNRSINWRAALEIFQESPWFGHGLGGFYIPSVSSPGEGYYAHNLFLELLTEQGIIGLFVLLISIIREILLGRNTSLLKRSPSGQFPVLIYMFTFVAAMISHDLTQTGSFIAICAVTWSLSTSNKNYK
jgi:hypothetical protein